MDGTPDLLIDPNPITPDTLFSGPARSEATREALAFRGDRVEKEPGAADEGAIVAAEMRLGVRLPETLRRSVPTLAPLKDQENGSIKPPD